MRGERHVVNQQVQRAGLYTSERIFQNDERSESSAPSGIGLETSQWNYTQLQLYITKGERAPLDSRGGNVEKRERSSLVICAACTCVYVWDTSALFWLWSCDFVRSRSWEQEVGKRKLYHLRVVRTHRGLAFSIFLSKWKFVKQNSLENIQSPVQPQCCPWAHVCVSVHLVSHTSLTEYKSVFLVWC